MLSLSLVNVTLLTSEPLFFAERVPFSPASILKSLLLLRKISSEETVTLIVVVSVPSDTVITEVPSETPWIFIFCPSTVTVTLPLSDIADFTVLFATSVISFPTPTEADEGTLSIRLLSSGTSFLSDER